MGSWVESEVAVFVRISTVAFLLFLALAGGLYVFFQKMILAVLELFIDVINPIFALIWYSEIMYMQQLYFIFYGRVTFWFLELRCLWMLSFLFKNGQCSICCLIVMDNFKKIWDNPVFCSWRTNKSPSFFVFSFFFFF